MPAELVLHAGGKEVSYEDLARVDLPSSTKTWVPIRRWVRRTTWELPTPKIVACHTARG